MSTRSHYLARRLLERARTLAAHAAEDPADSALLRERLRDQVAKVLVGEEGITEETKIGLVLEAMPTPGRAPSEHDLRELAACLEARLWR